MKQEKFTWVKGYEYHYVVSNKGVVISFPRRDRFNRFRPSRILPIRLSKQGYGVVDLHKNGHTRTLKVHRLVAEAFIPNPENKPCVDHINTIKTDNRADNLRWATHKDNMNNETTRMNMLEDTSKFASQIGSKNPFSQQVSQYSIGGDFIASYESIGEAIRCTNVSYNSIKRNADGKTKSGGGYVWKYIGTPKKEFVRTARPVIGKKPVIQLSKSGEFISSYESVSAAAKATGFLPENISRAAKGITSKSYKGYIWIFEDDLK